MRIPCRRTTRGRNAAAVVAPAPSTARPWAVSARIVSGTVCAPASPAWLFAIAIASNPASRSRWAEPGFASSAFGPYRGRCSRVVSGDSRFATARSADSSSIRIPARIAPGWRGFDRATPRPSITSPPKISRTVPPVEAPWLPVAAKAASATASSGTGASLSERMGKA